MYEDDTTREPDPGGDALYPSTLFATLHGELTLHRGRDPVTAETDVYSLFYARSLALGWLDDNRGPGTCGFWGMNDAGQTPESGAQRLDRLWFQVGMNQPIPEGRPLPVQPFLACAGAVAARMGTLRLDTVQVLLPIQSLVEPADAPPHRSAVMNMLQASRWFDDYDPQRSARVRATLEGGPTSSIHLAAPGMLQWMHAIRSDVQKVFVCDSYSLTDDTVIVPPPFDDTQWLGPAQHRATFYGTLVEWSLDGVGWLAAFLASASSQNGVSTPLVLTVSRADGAFACAD